MTTSASLTNADRTVAILRRGLDRNSAVPIYAQMAEILIAAIKEGSLPANSTLGNEIEISDKLGIGRPTLRKAIGILVDRGLIVRRRGAGSVVVGVGIRRQPTMSSLWSELDRLGRLPTTRVLALDRRVPTPQEREILRLDEGIVVTHIRRLRLSESTPIAIMENILPGECDVIDQSSLEQTSLYRLMEHCGLLPHVASQVVGARLATDDECKLLDASSPSAVLTEERSSFDDQARVVEIAKHVFSAAFYTFEMNVVRNRGPG